MGVFQEQRGAVSGFPVSLQNAQPLAYMLPSLPTPASKQVHV